MPYRGLVEIPKKVKAKESTLTQEGNPPRLTATILKKSKKKPNLRLDLGEGVCRTTQPEEIHSPVSPITIRLQELSPTEPEKALLEEVTPPTQKDPRECRPPQN